MVTLLYSLPSKGLAVKKFMISWWGGGWVGYVRKFRKMSENIFSLSYYQNFRFAFVLQVRKTKMLVGDLWWFSRVTRDFQGNAMFIVVSHSLEKMERSRMGEVGRKEKCLLTPFLSVPSIMNEIQKSKNLKSLIWWVLTHELD